MSSSQTTFCQGEISTKFALSGPSATQLGNDAADSLAEGELRIMQLHNELRDARKALKKIVTRQREARFARDLPEICPRFARD